MRLNATAIMTALLLVTGCKTPSQADDVPAVIANPTEETHTQLHLAVTSVLNVPVTLARDALTSSSFLTLERKQHRSLEGRPATGRLMERPERFQLVRSNSDCVLIHLESGNRTTLENVNCMPEPDTSSP